MFGVDGDAEFEESLGWTGLGGERFPSALRSRDLAWLDSLMSSITSKQEPGPHFSTPLEAARLQEIVWTAPGSTQSHGARGNHAPVHEPVCHTSGNQDGRAGHHPGLFLSHFG